MKRTEQELARPQQQSAYRMLVRNHQVLADWQLLLHTRRAICTRFWDHVANTPTVVIGSRYLPLKGTQEWVEYEGQKLRRWQYEVDKGARIKVGVGKDFVVVIGVYTGHPKENE